MRDSASACSTRRRHCRLGLAEIGLHSEAGRPLLRSTRLVRPQMSAPPRAGLHARSAGARQPPRGLSAHLTRMCNAGCNRHAFSMHGLGSHHVRMCEAAGRQQRCGFGDVTVLAYFGSPHRSTLQPGSCLSSVRGTSASGSSACMQSTQALPEELFDYGHGGQKSVDAQQHRAMKSKSISQQAQ